MKTKTNLILEKQIGDSFTYAGHPVKIVDWKALMDPIFLLNGDRIDAWPIVLMQGRKLMVTDFSICEL